MVLHVRICAGAGSNLRPYRDPCWLSKRFTGPYRATRGATPDMNSRDVRPILWLGLQSMANAVGVRAEFFRVNP